MSSEDEAMAFVMNFLIGLLFGVGLVVSGMSNPAKVLNFLDLAGPWDPSLAFVMAGAVAVAFVGYRVVFRRQRPLAAKEFHLPKATRVEGRLVAGSAIFGIGWGLGGYCPGPALVALGLGNPGTWVFLAAMFCGFAVLRWTTGIAVPAGRRA
jgi:uncharacterized membrane protein YedE/YeeE